MKNIILALVVLFTLTACRSSDPVGIESVTLSKSELSMHKNDRQTLKATIHPSNVSDKSIVWRSSNETVASVSGGVVTALAAGEARITALANGKSATCLITVEPDIYVVGCERVDERLDGPSYATIWRNGIPTRLTDGKYYAMAYCLAHDGTDLYIGGGEMIDGTSSEGAIYARIWKNDKLIFENNEKPGLILAIAPNNGSLYAVGNITEDELDRPAFWKDGVCDTLNCIDYDGGSAYAIKILGSDIYIGGAVSIEDPAFGLLNIPIIWKNGKVHHIYTDEFGFIMSLDVSAQGDIYASGHINANAEFLKNDTWNLLQEGGSAPNIFHSGQDTYVTGYYFSNKRAKGGVWKNGQKLYTIDEGDYACTLTQSHIFKNNIYTFGDVLTKGDYGVIKVWKNGVLLRILNDGTKNADGGAMLIKE